MLNLPESAWSLINTVPFPEHAEGLFGDGRALVRLWEVDHCTGDLSLTLDDTGTVQATVHFNHTKLATVLAAAVLAWPRTVRPLNELATVPPLRTAAEWLPELLPLAAHNPRGRTTLYQRPLLRYRFEPTPGTTLTIEFSPDAADITHTVMGRMRSRDYQATTRFMQGLHDHP
ncbi:hypothetical protein OG613_48915 (plasmid) [Streptomyces sp. NBC_00015]|uniref:hypothetical protein n=1 Tax=Streptomyces sp. NBC_00015 TaxID=2903611 RepID=UPI002F9155FA